MMSFGDGSAVCQVGTHGADCGNRNRVGDRIANSQRLVEVPRVAESDCVGSRSCILDAFARKVEKKLRFRMAFHFQTVGKRSVSMES
jgi:hypothetical protein